MPGSSGCSNIRLYKTTARKYSTDQDNYIDFNGSKLAIAQTKAHPYKYTDLDFLFQEIEVLLTASLYDVFNAVDEFIDLRTYVFKTHVSASALQPKIMNIINRSVYILDDLMVEVEVSFMRGKVSDIRLIDAKITKNNDYTTKPEYQRRVFTFAQLFTYLN